MQKNVITGTWKQLFFPFFFYMNLDCVFMSNHYSEKNWVKEKPQVNSKPRVMFESKMLNVHDNILLSRLQQQLHTKFILSHIIFISSYQTWAS